MHDIKGLEALSAGLDHGGLFADLAYKSEELAEQLGAQGCTLHTPRKRTKGHFHFEGPDAWSRGVRHVRQPIEAFFAWLQEKTGFQRASRPRSTKGVLLFVWTSLLLGMLLLFSA